MAPTGGALLETDAGRGLNTQFRFRLPRGYVDEDGVIHRDGVMRLATARDELLPQRDPRVQENAAYLSVLLLSRVVTRIGSIAPVYPGTIEGLFASDLAFLQDMYRQVNQEGTTQVAITCPSCRHEFSTDMAGSRPGGS